MSELTYISDHQKLGYHQMYTNANLDFFWPSSGIQISHTHKNVPLIRFRIINVSMHVSFKTISNLYQLSSIITGN